jgi:nucleoside-diphosphate-sugar epimerase
MSKRALLVGGTGPTGPRVVEGLLERGFDVEIFHRGTHEVDLPPVRHIHGDPHFRESIEERLGSSHYELVIASYGRISLIAEAMRDSAQQFIAVGGLPRYRGFYRQDPLDYSTDPLLPVPESAQLVNRQDPANSAAVNFAAKIVETEIAMFSAQPNATYLVFPVMYGPRNVVPFEWSVVRRVRDGRRWMILPDDGLAIFSRGAAVNMAECVLLAADRPDIAAGQTYNCADDEQMTVRQFVTTLLNHLGSEMELVGIPGSLVPPYRSIHVPAASSVCAHTLLDTHKIRSDLGYADVVSPSRALLDSISWYETNPVTGTPPGFMDTFDYESEDQLIESWKRLTSGFQSEFPLVVPADMHPMPHPRRPGALVDERGR